MYYKSAFDVQNTVITIRKLNLSEKARQQNEAREEYYCRIFNQKKRCEEAMAVMADDENTKSVDVVLANTKATLEKIDAALMEKDAALASMDYRYIQLASEINQAAAEISRLLRLLALNGICAYEDI